MSLEADYTQTLVVHRPDGDLRIPMETWDGGDLDTDETKHRNPVTRKKTARGGVATRANVTMTAECDALMWSLKAKLEDSAGRDQATGVRQKLDRRGTAIGAPEEITGILKSPKYPKSNIDGGDVGMVEIEVSTDE